MARSQVFVALFVATFIGCAGPTKRTNLPPDHEPFYDPEQPTPRETQEPIAEAVDPSGDTINITDAAVAGTVVTQPRRPSMGAFKLCGSGKEENCGPQGIDKLIPRP